MPKTLLYYCMLPIKITTNLWEGAHRRKESWTLQHYKVFLILQRDEMMTKKILWGGRGGRKKDRERKELKTIILIVGINNSVSYFTSHSDENLWTVSCTPSEISQHWAQRNYLFLTNSSAKVGFIWLIRRRKRKINTLSSPLVKALAWDRGRKGFNFPSKQLFQYFYKIQQGKKAIKNHLLEQCACFGYWRPHLSPP